MAEDEADTGAKGKQGELLVIGELLQRGYQVYLPMVDQGIDCLVDIGGGNYKEIQIKYREDESIFNARKFVPRDSFYIACYLNSRHGREIWIIPSKVFQAKGKVVQVRGRDYIQLRIGKEGSPSYNELAEYKNFGVLLQGASKEVRKFVSQVSKRVEGPHFKQPEFEKEVLSILSSASRPMSTKEIVSKIEERLGSRFSKADLAMLTRGRVRWEGTARFAIYQGLKKKGLITAPSKNQWVITQKGREVVVS